MKVNSPITIIAAIAIILGFIQPANAQNTSPFWSLQGNSNATTGSKLGTTNAIPLKIYTNNIVRMNINNATGNVSIGNGATASPSYRLYVKGAAYGTYSTGTSYGIVGSGGSYGVYGSGSTAGVYAYGSGTYGTYSYGGTYGVYGYGGTYGVYGSSSSGSGLYGSSTSGFGFYGHSSTNYGGEAISDSSDGFDAYSYNGYYGIYSYGPQYIGVYGYGGSYGLFGSSSNYGVYGSGTNRGVYGTSSNGYGVDGESTNGDGGYFYASNGNGLVSTTGNNSSYWAGEFFGDVYSSTAFVTSDRNLKKNIQDVASAMSIINKLKPKFYEFKDDDKYKSLSLPKGTHYGLIAQDLEQVLPNLVKETKVTLPTPTNPVTIKPKTKDGKDENIYQTAVATEQKETLDVKAVNYIELISIMIKAMQEQNDKINALTQQVNSLMTSKESVNNSNAASLKLSSAYLGQSVPNPAKNSASIAYSNLPNNAKALLFVSDANGKMIKQMQLSSNSGVVNVDVSLLSAGTYTYSLLIDGKLAETKTLQVGR